MIMLLHCIKTDSFSGCQTLITRAVCESCIPHKGYIPNTHLSVTYMTNCIVRLLSAEVFMFGIYSGFSGAAFDWLRAAVA